MDVWLDSSLIFGILILLFMSGLPVAFCFVVVNVVGVWVFWGGERGLSQLCLSMFDSVTTFTLLPFPLFVLLGNVLFESGIATRAIEIVDTWLGRIPGRLSMLSVGSGVILSTLSGASVASVAILGSTLVPETERRGYSKTMALGPVLASGTLAMMIPPSGMAVLLASLAFISVGGLLMAGIIPGLIMAVFYLAYITIRCYLRPSLAPAYTTQAIPLAKKIKITIRDLLPVAVIIFLVIGVIFLGIATPSEAAALGALGAFILAACYRCLNWGVVKRAVLSATRIAVMLMAIVLGAKAFGQVLVFSGVMKAITKWVLSLPVSAIFIIIAMMVVVLVLGCFMDAVALIMMVIPLYMPIVRALHFNPLWFGLLLLVAVETSLVTPPFGLCLFVMKGVAPPDTTTGDLYRSIWPFIVINLAVLGLCIAFPVLGLWLPGMMQ